MIHPLTTPSNFFRGCNQRVYTPSERVLSHPLFLNRDSPDVLYDLYFFGLEPGSEVHPCTGRRF